METRVKVQRVQRGEDGTWVIHAPAKINLGLRVFPPRADGFHDVETWMVPVSWHDTLMYMPEAPLALRVTGRSAGVPVEMEKNLVGRAMLKLAAAAGRVPTGRLTLHKVIPHGGGLGGGSSDAAQALMMLHAAWNLELPQSVLVTIAAELGSDVPFFLTGSPALCTGRGEITTPLPPAWPLYAVLILPPEGLATKPVYQAFDAGNRVERTGEVPWKKWAQMEAAALNGVLVNDLEPAAYSLVPWLAELRHDAATSARRPIHMTGSGSTLYTLCASAPEAAALADALSQTLAQRATCLPVRILNQASREPETRKQVQVAIAIVWDQMEKRVLICKRKKEGVLGGYWEFPGGKRNAEETLEQCAAREVMEEVGMEIVPVTALAPIEHEYPHARVCLHPFVCRHVKGEPACLHVEEVRWIDPAEILAYTFPPANTELVKRVARGREGMMGALSV